MDARAVAARLLEADPDELDPRGELSRYGETALFDEGIDDIVSDARQLYMRLEKAGVVKTFLHEGDPVINICGTTGFDPSALSQAILRMAIERRGALGAKKAYELIKRHGHSVI
jgi:hypothetical protein